jgi:hypothetical protein
LGFRDVKNDRWKLDEREMGLHFLQNSSTGFSRGSQGRDAPTRIAAACTGLLYSFSSAQILVQWFTDAVLLAAVVEPLAGP